MFVHVLQYLLPSKESKQARRWKICVCMSKNAVWSNKKCPRKIWYIWNTWCVATKCSTTFHNDAIVHFKRILMLFECGMGDVYNLWEEFLRSSELKVWPKGNADRIIHHTCHQNWHLNITIYDNLSRPLPMALRSF